MGHKIRCRFASAAFVSFLREKGFPGGKIASNPAFMLPGMCGPKPNATYYGHVAAAYRGWIYDWTARQYVPSNPFPLMYQITSLSKDAQAYIRSKGLV